MARGFNSKLNVSHGFFSTLILWRGNGCSFEKNLEKLNKCDIYLR